MGPQASKIALPPPDLEVPLLHSAEETPIGETVAASLEPPIISAITIYHCTGSSTCDFSTTKFETWVEHEETSHPGVHSVWFYVQESTAEGSRGRTLTFENRGALEAHFIAERFPDDPLTGASQFALLEEDFFLGPRGLRGDNNGQLYWCGFCQKVWTCNMMGIWKIDRFEHIAAHFQPFHARLEPFDIKEWQYLLVVEKIESEGSLNGAKVPATAMVSTEVKKLWQHEKRLQKIEKKLVVKERKQKDKEKKEKDKKRRARLRKRVEKGMRKELGSVGDADDEADNGEDKTNESDESDETNETDESAWMEDLGEWTEDNEEDEEDRGASSGFSGFGMSVLNDLQGVAPPEQESMTDRKGKGKEQAMDTGDESMGFDMLSIPGLEEETDMKME